MSDLIYFDYNATTPIRPEVFEVMKPFLSNEDFYGNASSLHTLGQKAHGALEEAREKVGSLLGVLEATEIVFTSGGTESNNMAIKGAAFAHRDKGKHIITSSVEHHAVLNACEYLEKEHSFQVTYLPVDEYGRVNPADLKKNLRSDTILVTIMMANNEIGTIEPISELGKICRDKRVLFHTDAVQAVGKIRLDVQNLPVDMLSLSGHKIYGPKGVGALYLRQGVQIHPLLHGGAHEKKRRAGTENVAGAVGLGKSCEIAQNEMKKEEPRLRKLRDKLEKNVFTKVPFSKLNGHPTERLSNTTSFTFECVEGESLVLALDQAGFTLHENHLSGIEVSTGSACASGLLEPSHVLKAIGVPLEQIHGSVRFSLGHYTTEAHIDQAIEVIPAIVKRLRDLSPLWEDKMAEIKN